MAGPPDLHAVFAFETEYWETDEFRALEELEHAALALCIDYSTKVAPHVRPERAPCACG